MLIVEDDTVISRMVQDNLTYEGYEVEHVANGGDALSRARSFAPDLILLDLMLPNLDGFAICGAIGQSANAYQSLSSTLAARFPIRFEL